MLKTVSVKVDAAARDILDPFAFVINDASDTLYATQNLDGSRHEVGTKGLYDDYLLPKVWREALSFACYDMIMDFIPGRYVGSVYNPYNGVLTIEYDETA